MERRHRGRGGGCAIPNLARSAPRSTPFSRREGGGHTRGGALRGRSPPRPTPAPGRRRRGGRTHGRRGATGRPSVSAYTLGGGSEHEVTAPGVFGLRGYSGPPSSPSSKLIPDPKCVHCARLGGGVEVLKVPRKASKAGNCGSRIQEGGGILIEKPPHSCPEGRCVAGDAETSGVGDMWRE